MYQSINDILQHSSTALIVIDKQDAYCSREFRTSALTSQKTFPDNLNETIAKLDNFIVWSRQKNIPIIWTRMTEDPEKSPYVVAQRMLINKDKAISSIDSDGYDYHGLAPNTNEFQIDKYFPDAFSEAGLAKYLHKNGIETVWLTGGFASRCVFASSVGAQNNGFNAVVIEDLLITPNEFAHEVSVTNGIVHDVLGYVTSSVNIKTLKN
ncbi:cysteine hydrolase [Candidatus Nomurabacteria bacterium]|nr:cysteine hydrolase [Candidatus Nomurabacteria bacterium]